jgi:hypothetical protein
VTDRVVVSLDPEQVNADAETAEWLAAAAALVAGYFDALRDLRLPEALCIAIVRDWHAQYVIPDDE